HGSVKHERSTVSSSISRDRVRRVRMTTRVAGGRAAVTHYRVLRRLDTSFGKFSLLDVKIDTGRTHQIRVHMASLGHPVVGDVLYGAPRGVSAHSNTRKKPLDSASALSLSRNFLHAAELGFQHPRT